MATDRLPNHSQMMELIYNYTKTRLMNDASLNENEKELAARYNSMKDGKVFTTRFWKFKTNTTSQGEFLNDSANLEKATPSTDTVEGNDPFKKFLMFTWGRCNYTRDDDGTARITAFEGTPAFKRKGAFNIGTYAPTFYWKVEDHAEYYDVIASDSMHPEIGLVPWIDAVKADGGVLPYYVISAFVSVDVDGLPYSTYGVPQYGKASHNGMVTMYQKKGAGYWGAGSSRNLHAFIFLALKYATKNVQTVFTGCTHFNIQTKLALAESGVKRVLLSAATNIYEGACVSVGVLDGTDNGRGKASMHSTADRVRVKSIEQVTVEGTNYYALNLDVANAINTTTDMYVSSMPCFSGETDAVYGHDDGSYLSYTDGIHTFRIHGVEYMNGQGIVLSDTVLRMNNGAWEVLVAPKGVKHVTSGFADYNIVGKIPYNNGTDYWAGDFGVDYSTGALFPSELGGGDKVGIGDRVYTGGASIADGSLREFYALGHLGYGSYAGLCYVLCGSGLWPAYWDCGSCD